MKILVTGGAGFIGSHIVDLLIKNNHEVIVVDNLSSGKKENLDPKATLIVEDLRNYDKIKYIFEIYRPEVVYHLAAQIDLRKSIEEPVFDAEVNILSTINLLEQCKNHKVKRFIFSSSAAVYGDTETLPTDEETKENPITPYGIGKFTIEKYLKYYNRNFGLNYTILRYSNVFGPRQSIKGEAGVVAIFFSKISAGESPKIFGGQQTRDFVYVKDVARANLLALNDGGSEIYNVSTGVETTVNELFDRINELYGCKSVGYMLARREDEQLRSSLDNKKIGRMLKWSPEWDLKKGLGEMKEIFDKR